MVAAVNGGDGRDDLDYFLAARIYVRDYTLSPSLWIVKE